MVVVDELDTWSFECQCGASGFIAGEPHTDMLPEACPQCSAAIDFVFLNATTGGLLRRIEERDA